MQLEPGRQAPQHIQYMSSGYATVISSAVFIVLCSARATNTWAPEQVIFLCEGCSVLLGIQHIFILTRAVRYLLLLSLLHQRRSSALRPHV